MPMNAKLKEEMQRKKSKLCFSSLFFFSAHLDSFNRTPVGKYLFT